MADTDTTASLIFGNISDDSDFVHEAMQRLGFACAFSELNTAQMARTLTFAAILKRSQLKPEFWES